MPKQRLLMTIAGCLLLIGVIGAIFTFRSSGSAEEINKKEVIKNPGITNIQVETDNAAVEILLTQDDFITVEFSATEREQKKYKLKLEEKGQSLSVELNEKAMQFLFFQLDFDFTGPKVTVYLPQKQYDRLQVDVENGRVHAENITVSNATVETENGRVQLKGLVTDSTIVSSENGSITFDHVEGNVTSDVSNGRTTFITKDLDRSIHLDSENGRINIQTENEPTNAIIETHVENGRVEIFGKDTHSSIYGDGKHKITLSTENGSIKVSK